MAVTYHVLLIKKLKKQVALLQKKEERGRKELRSALKKMHQHGKVYKNKLAKKMKAMQSKIEATKTSAYAKAVSDLEIRMLKGVAGKARALASAAARIEKRHAARLAHAIAKKGKARQSSKG